MHYTQESLHHFQDEAGNAIEPQPGYQYAVIRTVIKIEPRSIGGPLIHLTHVLGEWP